MIWFGVPVFDWVILLVLLGLGIEAWLTTRMTREERQQEAAQKAKSGLLDGDRKEAG